MSGIILESDCMPKADVIQINEYCKSIYDYGNLLSGALWIVPVFLMYAFEWGASIALTRSTDLKYEEVEYYGHNAHTTYKAFHTVLLWAYQSTYWFLLTCAIIKTVMLLS